MNSRLAHPLILAAAGATAIVTLLFAAYFAGPVARWDATALDGLRTLSEHRWIWVISGAIAHTASPLPLALMLAAVCAAGVFWGRHRQVAAAVALVGGACVVTGLLKIAATHPRYQPILDPHQLGSAAFPSGHATAAMALALAAVLVAPSRWRLVAGIAGGGYALAVAVALMIQGWHFPSDVLAGFLVSATASMLVLAALHAGDGVGSKSGNQGEGGLTIHSIGVRAFELLGAAAAIGIGVLAITHTSELTSYAASHTSAVIAAVGVAVAAAAVVYGVAAELETR